MKRWGAMVVTSTLCAMACASNNGSGTTSAGTGAASQTTASHSASSSSSGGSGGSVDAICITPNVQLSNACAGCLDNLNKQTPCLQAFAATCNGDTGCAAYLACQNACLQAAHDAGPIGAGGGGTGCVQHESMDDAGSPQQNCIVCCQTGNKAGADTFIGDLINACVCTAGAPCAAACAM